MFTVRKFLGTVFLTPRTSGSCEIQLALGPVGHNQLPWNVYSHYYLLLNACRHKHFQKILWTDFVKFLYLCTFEPKNVPFTKNPNSFFYQMFYPYYQVQFI